MFENKFEINSPLEAAITASVLLLAIIGLFGTLRRGHWQEVGGADVSVLYRILDLR